MRTRIGGPEGIERTPEITAMLEAEWGGLDAAWDGKHESKEDYVTRRYQELAQQCFEAIAKNPPKAFRYIESDEG
jgi:hypothetical protein